MRYFKLEKPFTQLDHQAQAETNMNRVYSLMKDLQQKLPESENWSSPPRLYIRIKLAPTEES